jgi:hypothetical protein
VVQADDVSVARKLTLALVAVVCALGAVEWLLRAVPAAGAGRDSKRLDSESMATQSAG